MLDSHIDIICLKAWRQFSVKKYLLRIITLQNTNKLGLIVRFAKIQCTN